MVEKDFDARPSVFELISYFYCTYSNNNNNKREVKDSVYWKNVSGANDVRKRCSTLLSELELVNDTKSHCACEALMYFCKGSIVVPTSRERAADPTITSTIKGNVKLLSNCGALPTALSYLSRCLNTDTSSSWDKLHSASSLVFFLLCFAKAKTVLKQHYDLLNLMMKVLTSNYSSPGFPTKRLVILFYQWTNTLLLNNTPAENTATTNNVRVMKSTIEDLQEAIDSNKKAMSTSSSSSDPYSGFKRHVIEERVSVIRSHLYKTKRGSNINSYFEALNVKKILGFYTEMLAVSCKAALHAQDQIVFYTVPYQNEESEAAATSSTTYWSWMKREQDIGLEIILLIFLTWLKNTSLSSRHLLAHQLLNLDIVPTLLKFMNKDVVKYIDFKEEEVFITNNSSSSNCHARIILASVRVLQKVLKPRPSVVKSVVKSLGAITERLVDIEEPDLISHYALKLIKLQLPFLGESYKSKHMCIISRIYCTLMPHMNDPWLDNASDNTNTSNNIKRLMLREKSLLREEGGDTLPNSTTIAATSVTELGNEDWYDATGGAVRREYYNALKQQNQHQAVLDMANTIHEKNIDSSCLPLFAASS